MKTDLGLDLKRIFWYELRIKQDLEDLVRRIQHAASGAADRFAHSAGPGAVEQLK